MFSLKDFISKEVFAAATDAGTVLTITKMYLNRKEMSFYLKNYEMENNKQVWVLALLLHAR